MNILPQGRYRTDRVRVKDGEPCEFPRPFAILRAFPSNEGVFTVDILVLVDGDEDAGESSGKTQRNPN